MQLHTSAASLSNLQEVQCMNMLGTSLAVIANVQFGGTDSVNNGHYQLGGGGQGK